jgi:hypothetical protein
MRRFSRVYLVQHIRLCNWVIELDADVGNNEKNSSVPEHKKPVALTNVTYSYKLG